MAFPALVDQVRQAAIRLRAALKAPSGLTIALGALSAVVIVALCWALFVTDPFGGQPMARAEISAPAKKVGEGEPVGIRMARSDDEAPAGSRADAHGGRDQPGGVIISDPLANTMDGKPELLEASRNGALPRISDVGERPLNAYARPAPQAAPGQPRIALIVSGLGLSAAGTENAIRRLPSAVTLAFAPYGRDLRRLLRLARTDGHELLLQAPLEPYDYPDNDPGPHTLLTSLPERQNIDRLHWIMSRAVGYVGMLNHMGAKFLADEPSVSAFLSELRDRGLMYVDDGTAPQNHSPQLSERLGMAFVKADKVIDAKPGRDHIDEAMSQLIAIAADRGHAVGVASALPGSVAALSDWLAVLENRNIVVVPVTALARGGSS